MTDALTDEEVTAMRTFPIAALTDGDMRRVWATLDSERERRREAQMAAECYCALRNGCDWDDYKAALARAEKAEARCEEVEFQKRQLHEHDKRLEARIEGLEFDRDAARELFEAAKLDNKEVVRLLATAEADFAKVQAQNMAQASRLLELKSALRDARAWMAKKPCENPSEGPCLFYPVGQCSDVQCMNWADVESRSPAPYFCEDWEPERSDCGTCPACVARREMGGE